MNTAKIFILSLMAFSSLSASAQKTITDVETLQDKCIADPVSYDIEWFSNMLWASDTPVYISMPEETTTKDKKVEWAKSYNVYKVKDSDEEGLGVALLKAEGDSTVLHLYYTMPADAIKNMWLGGGETFIVDAATGDHYKGHAAADVWDKTFGVKEKKGSVIEFLIVFPKLKEYVKEIQIYGVPAWNLRGCMAGVKKQYLTLGRARGNYDTIPNLRVPQLIEPAHNYNPDDYATYAVYGNPQFIRPMKNEFTYAMWRTPDVTYLAVALEMNWNREYFSFSKDAAIIDQATGRRYKIRKIQGLPFDTLFMIDGHAGDWISLVFEFPPLPVDVTTITYSEPSGNPFAAWGANWDAVNRSNLDVQEMRDNQKLFEYQPETIYE